MDLFALIMYVLALLLFLAAAAGVPSLGGRFHPGWLGLACALLPTLVDTASRAL